MVVVVQRGRVDNFERRRHARNRIVQRRRHALLVVVVVVHLRDFTGPTRVYGRPNAAVGIVAVLIKIIHADLHAASRRWRHDALLLQLEKVEDREHRQHDVHLEYLQAANNCFTLKSKKLFSGRGGHGVTTYELLRHLLHLPLINERNQLPVLQQLIHRRSLRRIRLHHASNHRLKLGRQRLHRIFGKDQQTQLLPQGSVRGKLETARKLQQRNSQAENVVGEAVVALHQLRRQVPRVAFHRSTSRGVREVKHETEVGKLAVVLVGDQNVVELDVKVHKILVMETLQGQQHVEQEGPDEALRDVHDVLHVILDTASTQLDLHEEKIVLLPRFVQRHAVLVVGELLVAANLLQSLAAVSFAPEDLLHLLYCIKLSVVPAAHVKHFPEASLAQLPDRLEALLEVRLVLLPIVEAAGQQIKRRVAGLRR